MSIDITASSGEVTADSDLVTADASRPIPAGWPCAMLAADPPSVSDRQASPTADELLPQVLALTPRGAAWGSDESGDGRGASPVMRLFWRAIAAWAADLNAREFDLATQAFPSAITSSLPDWEAEYGLPDTCSTGQGGPDTRVLAVRGRFGAVGGASPVYFVCLAKSAGYDITIEEPTQFLVDISECAAPSIVETWFEPGEGSLDETWFVPDDSALDDAPLEGFVIGAASGEGSDIGPDGDALDGFVLSISPDLADEVAGGIDETWFAPDGSEIGADGDPVEDWTEAAGGTVWKTWLVHVIATDETWFRPSDPSVTEAWFAPEDGEVGDDHLEAFATAASPGDGSEIGADGDPVEGFTPAADLECLFRRLAPKHTELIFDYAALA